jgi:hypothetical protein
MLNVNALGLPFKPLVCNHPAPVMDGCVLYLDGRYGGNNPATQTWYDLSGMGNDGTLNNFAYAEGSGWTGQGLQFDGTDDYVEVPHNESLDLGNVFTISFWINFKDADRQAHTVISLHRGEVGTLVLDFRSGIVRAFVDGTLVTAAPFVFDINKDYHIAYIRNGTTSGVSYFYINGESTPLTKDEAYTFIDTTGDLRIGWRADGFNTNGIMRDIAIYNRALSQREITQNYLATKCIMPLPHVGGAVLDLRGREGTNSPPTTVWQDASGHGNHATLKNVAYTAGDGWTGAGLELDGVDSYGEKSVPDSFLADGKHTVEMWCNPADLTGYRGFIEIADKNTSNNIRLGRIMTYNDGETIRYHSAFIGDSPTQYAETKIGLNKVVHIVGTFDGSKTILYINGIKAGEKLGADVPAFTAGQKVIYIGQDILPDRFFKGTIHNVRIYPKALSDSEVLQNYLAAKFCPLFHTYNTAGVEWEVATSTKMTRLGTTVNKTAGSDFDSIYPYSEMKLCNVNDNGEITAYIGDSGFKRDGTNGQVMVKIPKFYYRHVYGEAAKKHQFWISEHPISGFKLHPAFIRAGVEKPYVLLGAYKASFGRNQANTADALASVSGAFPAVSKTIDDFRDLAEARGTETGANWTQADALTRNAVALLYLVEYADTNCQEAIGNGVVDLDIDGTAVPTGSCDSLAGASGMADGTNGQVSVSYRGLEDLWGNVWEFVDGINIKADHRPYVADHGFASDVFNESYTDAGFDLPSVNGYVSNFACSAGADWLLMPSAVGASSGYIPDYYYQATGNRVALVGGHWYNGARAGLFGWNVYGDSSSAHLRVGARLLQIP